MASATRSLGLRAAQQRAHAREQLARAEGLGEVIVGAQLQAHYAVRLLGAAGQHQDRDAGLVAQSARDVHAVLALEAHVEDHRVHHLASHRRGELRAVRDRRDADVVFLQVFGDESAHCRVVVQR